MNIMSVFRCIHTSACLRSVSKSDLAKLRKKTGYTFANCRKALELYENDVGKAAKWLEEQARAMGWEKANKLSGRPTAQGLIGAAARKNKAVMVEINCETDFVARTEKFKSLVEMVTTTCLRMPAMQSDTHLCKNELTPEEISALYADDGKPLGDHLALLIGSVSENIVFRRGFYFTTAQDNNVAVSTHPPQISPGGVMTGKYAALVAYNINREESIEKSQHLKDIGSKLCQHVIGMSPLKVGSLEDEDEPNEDIDNETTMIHQIFLLDPDMTVNQLLQDTGVKILDFLRIECGEEDSKEVPVSNEKAARQPSEG